MTRVLDLRLQSSGGFIDAIRRVEYLTLLVMSASVLVIPNLSVIIAVPLVLLALMLVPRPQHASASLDKVRLDTLNDVQNEGLVLRSRWQILCEQPLTEQNAIERWSVRREIIQWMANCDSRLKRFPEVGGILAAHERKDDLVEELDSCLVILSRLRRLVSLSGSLNLPI